MKPQHHHILLALADHAHPDGTSAYPSVARLAAMTNYSERSVTRILGDLVEAKLIEVEMVGWVKNGKPMPTMYRLPMTRQRVAAKMTPDNLAPANLSDSQVTSSTKPLDNLAPEPKTGTTNTELKEATGKPSPDPVAVVANQVLKQWWDSFSPPPTGRWNAPRGLVSDALKAGWSPDAVSAALATFTEPVFNRRALEQALRNSHRRVGPWEGTATGSTTRVVTADEFYGVKPSEGVHR